MVKNNINIKKKSLRMSTREKRAYEDMLMGRALRIVKEGNFIPLDEALAKIRAGI